MDTLILILYYIFNLLIRGLDFLMLVRVICSWIPNFRSSVVYRISFATTEPMLRPLRNLLFRWEFARRCPIDLAFIALYILLEVISRIGNWLFVMLLI